MPFLELNKCQTPVKFLLALLLMVLGTGLVAAQSITGDPVDLEFEVINATTGQSGTISRLLMQYSSIRLEPIFDIEPSGSLFEVPGAPIKDRGKYIMTAWRQGVPYYWSLRGRDLKEKPVKLHVFDTASGLDDVTIVGLNLLMRKTQSLLEMEYLIQVENSARPQVSIVGEPRVSLILPAGARSATLSYGNGPEPEELEITSLPGGRAHLAVPLTTGRNPMRLKTTVEWSEGMTIAVGANVPIRSWSLMASPVNLDIQAFDLVPTDISGETGHLRYKGPEVAAEESFTFRMATLSGTGQEEELFTQNTDQEDKSTEESTNKEEDEDNGFPFVAFTPILIIIIVLAARRRRQS